MSSTTSSSGDMLRVSRMKPEKSPFKQLAQPKEPLVVVDLGSKAIRGLELRPNGDIVQFKIPSGLATALGKDGHLNGPGLNTFLKNWNTVQRFLKQQEHLKPENLLIVATEGLRGCKQVGAHLAKALGIHILHPKDEGAMVFRSVMHQSKADPQRSMVLEVGGASTELAFADRKHNIMLPIGNERSKNHSNPYDPQYLNQFSSSVAEAITAALPQEQLQKARELDLWIAAGNVLRKELKQHGLSTKKLTLEQLQHFLKTDHVNTQGAMVDDRTLTRLAIFSGVMQALEKKEIRLSPDSGMRLGLMLTWMEHKDRQNAFAAEPVPLLEQAAKIWSRLKRHFMPTAIKDPVV